MHPSHCIHGSVKSKCEGRLYALQQAMEIPKKDKDTKEFLSGLMQVLETSKKTLPNQSKDEAQSEVEAFALQIFNYADTEVCIVLCCVMLYRAVDFEIVC